MRMHYRGSAVRSDGPSPILLAGDCHCTWEQQQQQRRRHNEYTILGMRDGHPRTTFRARLSTYLFNINLQHEDLSDFGKWQSYARSRTDDDRSSRWPNSGCDRPTARSPKHLGRARAHRRP